MNRLTCSLILLFSFSLLAQSQDVLPPIARCKTGLVVVLPSTGIISVNATQFDDGSTDNVTDAANLKFYFDNNPTFTSIEVDCATFESSGATSEYVTEHFLNIEDEAGNISACGIELRVQDNKNICGFAGVECMGCVLDWRKGEMLVADYNCDTLDKRSCYSVQAEPGLSISFCKNDDILNGISTKDLVGLQRHLLGITPFEEPEVYIAADVNNNQDISSADISALRKVILGIRGDWSEFNQLSYRIFVKQDTFNSATAEGEVVFSNSTDCPNQLDFTAIKIGDIVDDGGFNDNVTREKLSATWRQDEVGIWHLYLNQGGYFSGGEARLTFSEKDKSKFASGIIPIDQVNYIDGQQRVSWVAEGENQWLSETAPIIDWDNSVPPQVEYFELYDDELRTRFVSVNTTTNHECEEGLGAYNGGADELSFNLKPKSWIALYNLQGHLISVHENSSSVNQVQVISVENEGIYFLRSSVCQKAQKIMVIR